MAKLTVIYKPTGQMGTIDDFEFDESVFELVKDQSIGQDLPQGGTKGLGEKIGGGLLNLVKSIGSPFVRTGENIADAATTIPQAATAAAVGRFNPQAGARIASVNVDAQNRVGKIAGEGETFRERILDNEAVKQQVADSLEIGSFAVPFGKARVGAGLLERAVTKAVLPGAVVGALSSPEASKFALGDEDANVEKLVGSAAIGAVIPVALNLGGKILSKTGGGLISKGGSSRESVLGFVDNNLKQMSKRKKMDLVNKLEKMKVPSGSADKKAKWAVSTYDNLYVKYKKTLSKITKSFDNTESALRAIEKSGDLVDISTGLGKTSVDKWSDKFVKATTAEELSRLKFELQDIVSSGGRNSDTTKIAKAFSREVDKALVAGNDPVTKKLSKILDDMSTLHQATGSRSPAKGGGIIRASQQKNLSVPLAQSVKIPGSRRTLQSLQDKAGKLGVNVGGALSAVQQVTGQAPNIVKQFAQQEAVRQGVPALSGKEEIGTLDPQSGLVANAVAQQAVEPVQPQTLTGFTATEYAEAYGQALLAGDSKAASKLKALYELENDNANIGDEGDLGSALKVINALEQLFNQAQAEGLTAQSGGLSRISGFAKGKTAAITQSSPVAATYDSQRLAFVSLIVRGLGEKGVLTSDDVNRVVKALPGFSTSPETAALNWQTIRDILQRGGATSQTATSQFPQ